MDTELKAAREALERNVTQAREALHGTAEYQRYQSAKARLQKFDSAFSDEVDQQPTPQPATSKVGRRGAKPVDPAIGRKKPGPKPGTPRGVKKAAVDDTRKKPGPKPGTKKKAADGSSNATEGRRAVIRGDRPPVREAMATVMLAGHKTMTAPAMVEALTKRDWLPNADKPQEYISFTFSKNPDIFERVSRGEYRLKASFKKSKAAKAMATAKTTSNAHETAPAATRSFKGPTGDEALAELGITPGNVSGNPFAAE